MATSAEPKALPEDRGALLFVREREKEEDEEEFSRKFLLWSAGGRKTEARRLLLETTLIK